MVAELSRDDVLARAARRSAAGCTGRRPSRRRPLGERSGAPRPPQGRALPAHRLVQAARRADEARVALDEEKARGVIGISAGNHAQALAYCAAHGGHRRARRHVARRRARRRSRRPARTAPTVDLERAGPGEAFDRLDRADRRDGPHARPPLRRPARRSRARGRSASRCSRTCPTPTSSSCRSAAAG